MIESKLHSELRKLIPKLQMSQADRELLIYKLSTSKLTRHDDPASHLDVMLLIYDPRRQEILIGDHKKSGLWLVNGGHLEPEENLAQAASRELAEEVGWQLPPSEINPPEFLTICSIENDRQACRRHYDIWFFLATDKEHLLIDAEKMRAEYHEWGWFDLPSARKLKTSVNHLQVFDYLEQKFLHEKSS